MCQVSHVHVAEICSTQLTFTRHNPILAAASSSVSTACVSVCSSVCPSHFVGQYLGQIFCPSHFSWQYLGQVSMQIILNVQKYHLVGWYKSFLFQSHHQMSRSQRPNTGQICFYGGILRRIQGRNGPKFDIRMNETYGRNDLKLVCSCILTTLRTDFGHSLLIFLVSASWVHA